MTRKKARHLMLELARRLYLQNNGNLKGFGKIAKFYRDSYRHNDYFVSGGYKATWNSELIVLLRETVGM